MTEAIKTAPVDLKYGETITAMMFYTQNSLIWGEIVHHEEILPSRVLVGVTTPEFISLYDAKMMHTESNFISKPVSYKEIHIPSKVINGYHLLPPQRDQLDYDETEPNRIMAPLTVYMGAFKIQGHLRISEITTVKSNIEVTKAEFLPLYDLVISHPHNGSLKPIQTNMGYFRIRANLFAV